MRVEAASGLRKLNIPYYDYEREFQKLLSEGVHMGHGASLVHRASSRLIIKQPAAVACSLTPFPSWVFLLSALWGLFAVPTEARAQNIADYWDKVYQGETVQPAPVPTSKTPTAPTEGTPVGGGLGDIRPYVTLRYGIEYTHNLATFTDRPTRTFVVDGEPPLALNPTNGTVNYPDAFRSTDNRMYSYLSFGTHGYGLSRLSTHVSLVTYHDLDDTRNGSSFTNILTGFSGFNRTELVNAYADMNGLTEEGPLSQVSARLGRQFAFDYDSWLLGSAVIDGASLRHHTERSDLTVFFGWREAFFADPSSRFTTGGSFSYRFLPKTTARVDFFHYQSSERYAIGLQHQFDTIFVDTYVSLINTDPIEFGSRATYSSPDSPWTVYASFLQQLSANDFIYDVWFTSRDQDRIRRLNLFRISPASQFILDVDRRIFWWLSVGAGGWLRFLNSGDDQGPFDNAFQEGSIRLLLTPLAWMDYFAQYRYRHIERSPTGSFEQPFPFAITTDVSRTGETSYQEVSAEARYRLHNRLRIMVGGYFRLLDTQTPYQQTVRQRIGVSLKNIDTGGLYAGFRFRLTDMIDFKFQYGVDSDYREFNPDIDLAHMFRIGVDFHYN
jgi:hypothetical protein